MTGPFADDFFPFSLTRSVADIRCGILTIRQKWAYFFPPADEGGDVVEIPANVIPSAELAETIRRGNGPAIEKALAVSTRLLNSVDIIRQNDREIRSDFTLITRGRLSAPVPESNRIIFPGPKSISTRGNLSHQIEQATAGQIFIEEGAVMGHSMLNATDGPIYIGKNALVMEGCMIRGPFALGEHAVLKMGSKIYGATTIGLFSVAGGEIKNSVIFGYSNKAHDGYLGDSVIGEWCNLGAGTSCSNVKNSAGAVKYRNPLKNEDVDAGMKCGLLMGDYSRSAINTAFNTGTVAGVCVNAFGKGLTASYLSSFTWGFDPPEKYAFEKAVQHIRQWKKLKGKLLTDAEITQLKIIFDQQKNLS
ncbi:MAG: putative sugar nucleotidyl transferase [Bacteroidota bacterium]|nr:putative sugar nucleotidyl transferase [Bacteroidota bacterium]MDP4251765.1 putative sugar nucleotidyl transferase [Bacteroidota bacterium]